MTRDQKVMNQWIKELDRIEGFAATSKLGRMLKKPYKYWNSILFRELIYKKTKRAKKVEGKTFFGSKVHLLLPSSTDIYLAGGKSHDSEIRLAKFLITHLNESDTFVDIGAHYGYFTLLGAQLVGDQGRVYAFEASPVTYGILSENCSALDRIEHFNLAVSDKEGTLSFYEFPNLYSEYNSLLVEQYVEENWFSDFTPKEIQINSICIDIFFTQNEIQPKVIKIDVEGAEDRVIRGMKSHLEVHSPFIVLEYLSSQRGNNSHKEAEALLIKLGYQPHQITKMGDLLSLPSVSAYLEKYKMESDNIVFVKR